MSDRDSQARVIFEWLLQESAAERHSRIPELTADEDLRQRVRRLLDAHERAVQFDSVIPTPDDAVDPERIGPYRVLERIGEGGMGVVYLAEQKKPVRRKVAIKIVRPGMATPEVINRFNAERQALAMMSHPGIARILDAGSTDAGLPYFVMEYVAGTPLIRYCDQHRLPLKRRIELMRLVCLAVHHAHQKGVIHRDLKPSNILVVEENGDLQPRIIDFGIAKAVHQPLTGATLHTRIGNLIGTPDYMSPEQCDPAVADIDTRSDIYSLGVLLYQLLSSQLPYGFNKSSNNEIAITHRVLAEDPRPASQRARDASAQDAANRDLGDVYALERRLRGELDWITGKAMERDRNRRYTSAQELADDLKRYLDDEPVAASPPSFRYRTGKFFRRHTLGVSLLASVFLLVSAFAVVLGWQLEQVRQERDRANQEAATADFVTRFLLDTFRLPEDLDVDTGRIALHELLENSRRELEDQHELDPETRLKLYSGLANAYENLSLFNESAEMRQRALENLAADTSPDNRARIFLDLGRTLRLAHRTREARDILQEAIALSKSAGKDIHPIHIETQRLLAAIERDLGNHDNARQLLEQLFFAQRNMLDGDSREMIETGAQLVPAYWQNADIDAAEKLANELLGIAADEFGENSGYSYQLRSHLAWIYMAQGRLDEARALNREIYETYSRNLGRDNAVTLDAATRLAASMENAGTARTLMVDVISLQEKGYGTDAPQLVASLVTLARIHSRLDGFREQAIPMLERAMKIVLKHHGRQHQAFDFVHYGLATVSARLGNHDTALAQLAMISDNPLLMFWAVNDEDFSGLKNDPRFARLVSPYVQPDNRENDGRATIDGDSM